MKPTILLRWTEKVWNPKTRKFRKVRMVRVRRDGIEEALRERELEPGPPKEGSRPGPRAS